jgi:nitrate reductase beta subunit
MEYRYAESRPEKQFAAVFNTNRCIACQTCTMACKSTWTFSKGQEYMWWNNVETKPFGGYPQSWDSKLLSYMGPQEWNSSSADEEKPYGEFEGKTIFDAAKAKETAAGYIPKDEQYRAPNIGEDVANKAITVENGIPQNWSELPQHKIWFFYLARICNHCTYPACLAACPRAAIYKRSLDGIVVQDQSRCRGYRHCVRECPYKKAMYNGFSRVTEKCIACYPRVEKDMVTRCILACVGKIRLQGWITNEKSPIYYLVRKAKVALPLYPQWGTEPNVYYIPPQWVPYPYLEQMFGPGVRKAVKKIVKPSHELLGVLQLFGVTQSIIHSYAIDEKDAVGFDEKGKEIIRVPIESEVVVRDEAAYNNVT